MISLQGQDDRESCPSLIDVMRGEGRGREGREGREGGLAWNFYQVTGN